MVAAIHSQILYKIASWYRKSSNLLLLVRQSRKIHSILLIRNQKILLKRDLRQKFAKMILEINNLKGLDLITTGPSQLGFTNETWLPHCSQGTIIAHNTRWTQTNTKKFFYKTPKFVSNRGSKRRNKVFITRQNKTLCMMMKTSDHLL